MLIYCHGTRLLALLMVFSDSVSSVAIHQSYNFSLVLDNQTSIDNQSYYYPHYNSSEMITNTSYHTDSAVYIATTAPFRLPSEYSTIVNLTVSSLPPISSANRTQTAQGDFRGQTPIASANRTQVQRGDFNGQKPIASANRTYTPQGDFKGQKPIASANRTYTPQGDFKGQKPITAANRTYTPQGDFKGQKPKAERKQRKKRDQQIIIPSVISTSSSFHWRASSIKASPSTVMMISGENMSSIGTVASSWQNESHTGMDMGEPIVTGQHAAWDMNSSDHAKGGTLHRNLERSSVALAVLFFMLFIFALGLKGKRQSFEQGTGNWELECAMHHLDADDVKQKIG
jgi:hypothetical protein